MQIYFTYSQMEPIETAPQLPWEPEAARRLPRAARVCTSCVEHSVTCRCMTFSLPHLFFFFFFFKKRPYCYTEIRKNAAADLPKKKKKSGGSESKCTLLKCSVFTKPTKLSDWLSIRNSTLGIATFIEKESPYMYVNKHKKRTVTIP